MFYIHIKQKSMNIKQVRVQEILFEAERVLFSFIKNVKHH